jgi:hypothetical protein
MAIGPVIAAGHQASEPIKDLGERDVVGVGDTGGAVVHVVGQAEMDLVGRVADCGQQPLLVVRGPSRCQGCRSLPRFRLTTQP